MFAPLLCPAIVIFDAEPPKLGTTFCRNVRALIVSPRAMFVFPAGSFHPSYEQSTVSNQSINRAQIIISRKPLKAIFEHFHKRKRDKTYCTKAILDDSDNRVRCGGQIRTIDTSLSS